MANLPSDPSGKRFTDREMKLIFERAGEAAVAAESEQGHSLAEMQEIARQVGLDPADIAKAASTLRAPETSNPILGAPVRFQASRTLPVKLTDERMTDIAVRIREATGLNGEWRDAPGGTEWRARTATGRFVVNFTARGDGTRIDVSVGREDEAVLTAIASAVGGGIVGIAASFFIANAVGAVGSGEVLVSAATAIAGAVAGMRLVWPRFARRWTKKTDALLQAISETAAPPTNENDENE